MMSDATAEAGMAQEEAAAPTGELTELARLEIRIGKIVEVTAASLLLFSCLLSCHSCLRLVLIFLAGYPLRVPCSQRLPPHTPLPFRIWLDRGRSWKTSPLPNPFTRPAEEHRAEVAVPVSCLL